MPHLKPIRLKLFAQVKENSEAQNLQNFDAILRNPWISSAMTMAMSIYRTLCVLISFRCEEMLLKFETLSTWVGWCCPVIRFANYYQVGAPFVIPIVC